MQKIEASNLLSKIFTLQAKWDATTAHTRMVILTDETIFRKCVEDVLHQKTNQNPQVFEGAQALFQYHQLARQMNLFDSMKSAIIFLDDSFSKKNIPNYPYMDDHPIVIFGSTVLRQTLSESAFPHFDFYLCYSPFGSEKQKCATLLLNYYFAQKEFSNADIEAITSQALMHYNDDLYHIALHFERMKKSGMGFEDAKILAAEVSAFDVISTLLEGSIELLDLRLTQYAANGQDAAKLFPILVYFFKQLACVYAELQHNSNLNLAFKNAHIPYPAQAQIKKALHMIPYEKVEHFFSICAQLELELREHKNAHQILFLELKTLIVPPCAAKIL